VKPVHLGEGQFKDLDDIFLEKKKLVEALPEKGVAILNADDPYVAGLRTTLKCKKILFGGSEIADLRVLAGESTLEGIRCTIEYKGEVMDADFPLLGSYQVYVLLPAIAAGLTQGFSLRECVDALKKFTPPPGRMTVIPGIKGTTILDSTYNASPDTMKEALSLLREVAPGRKIAVLGNMNELGDRTDHFHREIGRHASRRADILVTVGDLAKVIGEEAQQEGLPPEGIHHYPDPLEAAKFLSTILEEGDTILVKGSQNRVRLEKLVAALMADPSRAGEMLVRQEKHWKRIS
jgi:UDP-N-acetylmuramoyl-tripeptide--D-alanyl-D-alanine ligase